MPPTIDAVLADGVLVPVTRDDHLVREIAGQWLCVRPRHNGQPCTIPPPTAVVQLTRSVGVNRPYALLGLSAVGQAQ